MCIRSQDVLTGALHALGTNIISRKLQFYGLERFVIGDWIACGIQDPILDGGEVIHEM